MHDRAELLRERLGLVPAGSSFLCSYPRSGSIWLRYLVYDINWLQTGHWFLKSGHPPLIHRFTPQMELRQFPANFSDTTFEWKLIKTHLPRGWIAPLIRQGKAVVLLRQPADAFLSAYTKRKNEEFKANELAEPRDEHRIKRLASLGPDAYCLHLVSGWRKYVEGYLAMADRNPGRVMFATYEGLKQDPVGVLAALMRFFERPARRSMILRAVRNRDIARTRNHIRSGYGAVNIGRGAVGQAQHGLAEATVEEIHRKLNTLYEEVRDRSEREIGR